MPVKHFDTESFATSKPVLDVVVYALPNGSCPAFDFIDALKDPLRKKRFAKIVNIALYGMEVAKSQSRYLHDGVSELKNPRDTRILWAGHGKGRIVILSAKKSRQTPKSRLLKSPRQSRD
jgi:phage-related protein